MITPGGPRPKEIVHHIGKDYAVQIIDKRLHKVHKESGRSIKLSHLAVDDSKSLQKTKGWIAYAHWSNDTGHPVAEFNTTWIVPDAPSENQGLLYFFNGIDPSDYSTGILQPVLQYGVGAAGGGNYWAIANWYVHGDGTAVHSDLIRVNNGETLTGKMYQVSEVHGAYTYESEFTQYPKINLQVKNLPELVWFNETLEAYGISSCAGYPKKSLNYTGISITLNGEALSEVSWATSTGTSKVCNESATVVNKSASNGKVTINF